MYYVTEMPTLVRITQIQQYPQYPKVETCDRGSGFHMTAGFDVTVHFPYLTWPWGNEPK